MIIELEPLFLTDQHRVFDDKFGIGVYSIYANAVGSLYLAGIGCPDINIRRRIADAIYPAAALKNAFQSLM